MKDSADFEAHRDYLLRLAYRLLGSVADAEDMVQETWIRWSSAGEPELREPRAWLTTTCTRLALDRLKSAQVERSEYPGEWLPEPLLEERQPDERAELDETLSMALLATIERLSPTERAAFLLHDVFGYAFSEVGEILQLETANCRQLALRARKGLGVQRPRGKPSRANVEEVTSAFFDAIEGRDLGSLEQLLAAEVSFLSDGGGKASAAPRELLGVKRVTHFLDRVLLRPARTGDWVFESRWFNGAPGMVLFQGGVAVSAFQLEVHDGLVFSIHVQRNPDKLQGFRA